MKHLKENNHTYYSHFKFAISIFFGLAYRSLFFLVHGLMPNVPIPENFNLTKTSKWLESLNETAEKQKKT